MENEKASGGMERALDFALVSPAERQPPRNARAELSRAAKGYIESHCAEKFSLKKMAEALFVNECYLIRTFKSETGVTPLAYHNGMRCALARRLLTDSRLSAMQIAERLGFSSASHFAQVFKRFEGVTPIRYRENLFSRRDVGKD